MKRKILVLILTAIMMTMQSGCWGKLELNEIGLVRAIGIDLESDGHIKLTVLAIMPIGDPQASGQRSNTWIGSATGESISEAQTNLSRFAPRKIVFYHNEIILVGEELAKSGVVGIIDSLLRERAIRYDSYFLACEGTAHDLLITPAEIDKSLPEEIEGIIMQEKDWNKSKTITLREFAINLKTKYRCSVAGKIGLEINNQRSFSTFRESALKLNDENTHKGRIDIEGCAVFRGGQLVGFLDRNEARGYKWIAHPGERSVVTVTCGENIGIASVRVVGYSTKLKPIVENGRLIMEVRFESKNNELQHYGGGSSIDARVKKKIEEKAAEIIREEMKNAVLKAQTVYEADIFGFGEAVYRSKPELWKSIEDDWRKVYTNLEVRYNVDFFMKRPGEISDPIILDENSG